MVSRPRAPNVVWCFYVLTLLGFYLPLVGLFLGAFRDASDGAWTLRWVVEVFDDGALTSALFNSLLVSTVSASLSTLLGTMAALSSDKFYPNWWLGRLSYISLFLPEIVFALALLTWFSVLRLQLGFITVIIAHTTLTVAYVLLTVTSRKKMLERNILEAAADLGATETQIIASVTWPLLKPAVISGFVLSFLISFDDFLISFFVNGVGTDTLPVKLYTSMKMGLTPKLNALSVMMLIGTFAIFALFFRNRRLRDLIGAGGKDEG